HLPKLEFGKWGCVRFELEASCHKGLHPRPAVRACDRQWHQDEEAAAAPSASAPLAPAVAAQPCPQGASLPAGMAVALHWLLGSASLSCVHHQRDGVGRGASENYDLNQRH